MTSLEKLDAVLKTLIDLRTKEHITLERLFEIHGKTDVGFGDVTSALNKIEKDGYVDVVRTKIPDTESYSVYYKINFDGLVFVEQGGYINQRTQDRLSRSNQKVLVFLTWIIALGTSVAAVYYWIEVWKFFCNHQ